MVQAHAVFCSCTTKMLSISYNLRFIKWCLNLPLRNIQWNFRICKSISKIFLGILKILCSFKIDTHCTLSYILVFQMSMFPLYSSWTKTNIFLMLFRGFMKSSKYLRKKKREESRFFLFYMMVYIKMYETQNNINKNTKIRYPKLF